MLGDQVGEDKGKITSQRVLDVEGGTPKMETSFSATGKYRGVEAADMGTYSSTTRPGKIRFVGSLFFSTASTGKLAFLNNLVGVFEYESDEIGNTSSKVWEWK